jgi:transmembrane protein 33
MPDTRAQSERIQTIIGKWIKGFYDTAMTSVCIIELGLWLHILFAVLSFQRNTWILLLLYSGYLRVRFAQSSFMASVHAAWIKILNALFADKRIPPWVRSAWESVKDVAWQLVETTDLTTYAPVVPVPETSRSEKEAIKE